MTAGIIPDRPLRHRRVIADVESRAVEVHDSSLTGRHRSDPGECRAVHVRRDVADRHHRRARRDAGERVVPVRVLVVDLPGIDTVTPGSGALPLTVTRPLMAPTDGGMASYSTS